MLLGACGTVFLGVQVKPRWWAISEEQLYVNLSYISENVQSHGVNIQVIKNIYMKDCFCFPYSAFCVGPEIARNRVGFSHEVIQKTVSAVLPSVRSDCGRKETKWFSLPIRARISPPTQAICSVWCHANPRGELFICCTVSSNWFRFFR